MIPLITCEITCCQHDFELVFSVSAYLIRIWVSKLILSNNQSNATLWVLETCLIVGLLPFNDFLGHCFIVFKNVHQSFELRRFSSTSRLYCVFSVWRWGWCFGFHTVLDFSALDHRPFLFDSDLSLLDGCSFEDRNTSFTTSHKSRGGIPTIRNQHPKKQLPTL